jgi:hypothetical protein
MALIISLDHCTAIPPPELARMFTEKKLPKGVGGHWHLYNEIKPSDLYCYLYCKFGPPNGLQNLFRADDSDNFIHWEWTLSHPLGLVSFLGMNTRSEVQLMGDWDFPNCEREQLVSYIKRDIGNYGKQMSKLREEALEDWIIFVNPYSQLREAIGQLKAELRELKLNPIAEQMPNPHPGGSMDEYAKRWNDLGHRYSKGVGLAIGIRAMTPVLAESYINLLLFVLCRPEIKENERLYNSIVRANIDIKAQSLHFHCKGFARQIDWKSAECKAYNAVINDRNDMLHGNIVIEKQKFSEIYFLGTVPIFKKYEDLWQRSIGVSVNASGVGRVQSDLDDIEKFIAYVNSCLEPGPKQDIEFLARRRDLGFNKKTKRIGVLLPEHIIEFNAVRLVLPKD